MPGAERRQRTVRQLTEQATARHGGPPQGLGLRMSRSSLGLLKKHSVCYDRIRLCGLRIKIERLIGAYDNNPTDDGGLLQD